MNGKHLFDRHYKRLLTEGILKSVISGGAVCFGVIFIFSFLYWMFAIGGIWIGLLVGVLSGAAVGVITYRLLYAPNDLTVARRVDRYGLEERLVTMLELERDESYLAQLQRSDATSKLDTVSAKSIRYRLPIVALALSSVALTLCTCFTTLGALAGADIIPHGIEIINLDSTQGGFKIVYEAKEGGSIIGEKEQTVEEGEVTSPVLAVADEGWVFVYWDDGQKSPERCDTDLTSNTVVRAVFERIDGASDSGDESDSADDLPFGSADEETGDGESEEEDGENPDNNDSAQEEGKWHDKNQFIDGATYYRDYLDLYYQYAKNIFESNADIPKEIIEFFETYFSGI